MFYNIWKQNTFISNDYLWHGHQLSFNLIQIQNRDLKPFFLCDLSSWCIQEVYHKLYYQNELKNTYASNSSYLHTAPCSVAKIYVTCGIWQFLLKWITQVSVTWRAHLQHGSFAQFPQGKPRCLHQENHRPCRELKADILSPRLAL